LCIPDALVHRRGPLRRTARQDTDRVQHVVERAHRLDRLGRAIAVDPADHGSPDVPPVLDDFLRPITFASDVPATRAGFAVPGPLTAGRSPFNTPMPIVASYAQAASATVGSPLIVCRIAMDGVHIPKSNRPLLIAFAAAPAESCLQTRSNMIAIRCRPASKPCGAFWRSSAPSTATIARPAATTRR
jgi:hypothetical protein